MNKLLKVLSLSTLAYVMGKGVKTMTKPRKKYRLTADSYIVRGWIFLILDGKATIDDVPDMFNLIELVASLLKLEEVNEPTAEPGTEPGQEAPQPNI